MQLLPHPPRLQMELLQRTGWRVRLDLAADVLPCHALLFSPKLLGSAQLGPGQQQAQQALSLAGAVPQEWAAGMRRLCAAIRETVSPQLLLCTFRPALACSGRQASASACDLPHEIFWRNVDRIAHLMCTPFPSFLQSRRLKAHEQARSASSARLPTPECEDERPAKRQRSSAA